MRNLKRVLSLALALVMILGVMVMTGFAAEGEGAGPAGGGQGGPNATATESTEAPADKTDAEAPAEDADVQDGFIDADQIDAKYVEAVNILTGIGVLEGDDDGNFAPTRILKRAEAAKIISYLVLGTKAAELASANADTKAVFSDFTPSTEWAAGYVAYCANTGYIAGYGDGTFGPEDDLTGIAFAKLLLVALGYDAEVEGYVYNPEWITNIAVDAIDAGIDLDGVLLSEPLTREQAAQMAFQALQADTVEYESKGLEVIASDGTVVRVGVKGPYAVAAAANAADFDASNTAGDKTVQLIENLYPKLTRFTGVVTANEYADLADTAPLAAGKTTIGGVTYNISTEITDIGESRQGWALDKEILVIEDTGKNNVYETGEAVSKLDKSVKGEAGNITLAGAEHFFNFDARSEELYVSEYRIAYGDPDFEATTSNAEWTIIKAGTPIDADQLAVIKAIFDDADDTLQGAHERVVYVGTQNATDISDILSFNQFKAKYLERADEYATVTQNENGNWLKIVDNNGDGVADYVFKTDFYMSLVTAVTKNGISVDGVVTTGNQANASKIVSTGDVAVDDVVIYTIIDEVAYVQLADSVEATVQKYSYKDEILTTTDGEEYQQSGIGDLTNYIYNELVKLDDTTYILYLDLFGFVRVAALPDGGADDYILLTEFYNIGSNKNNLISSKTLIAETVTPEEEVEEYEVATKLTDLAEAGLTNTVTTNANNVLSVVGTQSWTNIAAYDLKDNGTINLDNVYNIVKSRQGDTIAETDYIALTNGDIAAGQKHFDIATTDEYLDTGVVHTGDYVNVTQNTIIFYVLGTGADEIKSVDVVTGYSNIVPVVKINAVYAVADRTKEDTVDEEDYWTAKILVIEAEDYKEGTVKDALSFVYSNPEKETSKVFSLEEIAADGTLNTLYAQYTYSNGQYNSDNIDPLAFYPTHQDSKGYDVLGAEITNNFAKWNIYAAEYKRAQADADMDYIDIVINGAVKSVKMPESAVAYKLSTGANGTYDASTLDLSTRNGEGDKIIYVTNTKGEIVYVIDVDASFTGKTDTKALQDLWNAIDAEQRFVPADPFETLLAKLGGYASAADITSADDRQDAQDALDAAAAIDLTTITAKQKADLDAAVALTQAAVNAYDAAQALAAKKAEVEEAGLAYIASKDAVWSDGQKAAANDALTALLDAATQVSDLDAIDFTQSNAAVNPVYGAAAAVWNAQNTAKNAVNNAVSVLTKTAYDVAEWNEILAIQTAALANIIAASSVTEIGNIADQAVADIAAVPTNAIKAADKELDDAKAAVLAGIEVTTPSTATAADIETAITTAITAYTNVTVSVSAVDNYASTATCTVTLTSSVSGAKTLEPFTITVTQA